MNRTIKLVDTSLWQASNQAHPPVEHFICQAAANQGVAGGYIKSTIGADRMDPEWDDTYACWGMRNKKRGNYHWFTAGVSGFLQANWYLLRVGLKRGELPMALDIEVAGLTAREIWNFAARIFEVERRWPVIYTGPWAWSRVKDSWTLDGLIPKTYKRMIAERCDLWQAQYPNEDDGFRIQPLSPIPYWSNLGKQPVMHQYSVKQGWGKKYGSRGGHDIDLDLADTLWFSKWPWPDSAPTIPLPPPPPVQHGWQLRAGVYALNVRERPWRTGPAPRIVGAILQGDLVQLKPERDGSWAELTGGRTGWVNASYLIEV